MVNFLAFLGDMANVPPGYLQEANEFIRAKCAETAVSFIYLPRPPSASDQHANYLTKLDELTKDLPPTLLVHGVSPVTTTTL